MEESGIGVSNLPNQRFRSIYKKVIKYNIMIAGGRGLGKTTFINNTFNLGIHDEVKESNEVILNKHSFFINENDYKIRFQVIEFDKVIDFTNNENSIEPIINHLKKELKNYKIKDEDNRIHALIYFFHPSVDGVKKIDLLAMQRISKYTNLIPVVPKSDLISFLDINNYKSFLLSKLEGVRLFDSIYFIINGTNEETRIYPWGVLNVNSISYNELNELKNIVLKKKVVDLIKKIDFFYVSFKTEVILEKIKLEIK